MVRSISFQNLSLQRSKQLCPRGFSSDGKLAIPNIMTCFCFHLCIQSTSQIIHMRIRKGETVLLLSHDNKLSGTLLLTDTEKVIKVYGQLSD